MAGPATKKIKQPYVDKLNPRYGVDAFAEAKRKQSEAWHALNQYITQEGGFVVTPPGKLLRVEVAKDSTLPAQLEKSGFNIWRIGANTRITSKGFESFDVLEISVDGR